MHYTIIPNPKCKNSFLHGIPSLLVISCSTTLPSIILLFATWVQGMEVESIRLLLIKGTNLMESNILLDLNKFPLLGRHMFLLSTSMTNLLEALAKFWFPLKFNWLFNFMPFIISNH